MQAMLGTRVRALRRGAGLSQARLAGLVGVSASYLNLIEHNRRRLPAELMFKLARVLHVDIRAFMVEEREQLHDAIMEVLGDPAMASDDIKAADVRVLVEAQPAVAQGMVNLYRKWKSAQETVLQLGGRSQDGQVLDGADAMRLPSEEVNDLVQQKMNYFDDLDRAAETLFIETKLSHDALFDGLRRALAEHHRVEVQIVTAEDANGITRQYAPDRRILALSEALPQSSRNFHLAYQLGILSFGARFDAYAHAAGLSTPASQSLCRMVLASYVAGAIVMPYTRFFESAEAVRYDIDLLCHRFRVSFEQVCHRLTTLRRPGAEGVSFHLVKTDTAGNISKRFSGTGIRFERFSSGCPRWVVNTAFMHPGQIRTQLSEMPDGSRYFCVARTVARRHGGWREPEIVHALGIGCGVEDASRLVYSDGLDRRESDYILIGTNCRTCERLACSQRAFPSLTRGLELDENVRRIAFYAVNDDT